jgi:hypothetical protein
MSDSDFTREFLHAFADQHGLKVKQPPKAYLLGPHPDRVHVPGKRGWIRACDDGLMKLFVRGHRIAEWLNEAHNFGMKNQDRGDTELMLWFDPRKPEQVAFALRLVGARKKRRVQATPEMLARLRKTHFVAKDTVLGSD